MSSSKSPSPDKIYDAALADIGSDITSGSLKLLQSGLVMLKKKQKTQLRKNELFAISSLISYKAYEHKTSETTVTSILQAQFNVEEIEDLPSHRYQHAINFLVDLEMNKVIN